MKSTLQFPAPFQRRKEVSVANIILIAGSGHGGWYFDPIAEPLRSLGHNVFQPSLSGLAAEEAAHGPVNLESHIEDVLALIARENLQDVVLVAHSYGGMVITGAAARAASAVKCLIYLDAMVPQPGQRQWELMDADTQNMLLSGLEDGFYLYPSAEFLAFRPQVRPHPFATMMQPLHYQHDSLQGMRKVFVFAEKYFGIDQMRSPFQAFYERYRDHEDWSTYSLPVGHDLIVEAPERVLEIILASID